LLKLAYDLDLAGTPAASQAAELLDRLATYAKISGESESETAASSFGTSVSSNAAP
jgi:hypothetical protein